MIRGSVQVDTLVLRGLDCSVGPGVFKLHPQETLNRWRGRQQFTRERSFDSRGGGKNISSWLGERMTA